MRHILVCIWYLLCGVWNLTPETLHAEGISSPIVGLKSGPTVHVSSVGYGASFDLQDGQRVRLLGLKVPKPDTPPFTADAEPLGYAAKVYVENFLRGHAITVFFDKHRTDRYGRWLVHAVRDDGVWLQQRLLQEGLARVYSFPDNRQGLDRLLAYEDQARQSSRGLWALPYYRVRTPDTVRADVGTYQIIEGRILNQNRGRGTVYLNFGQNWKQDFTVRIIKKYRRFFGPKDAFPDYAGLRVRVRGWVRENNGPMIDLTHPEQIEILSSSSEPRMPTPSPKIQN